MRPHAAPSPALPVTVAAQPSSSDWTTLKRLFPYLWEYKWRVVAALSFMNDNAATTRHLYSHK